MSEKKTVLIRNYRSIHDIDPGIWDSILTNHDFFHTHGFISSIENAGVMDADFHYLLFYADSHLIASAALSSFSICLDLFISPAVHRLFNRIRRFFPGFFTIKILFCGLPISIGKHNLIIMDNTYTGEVMTLLLDYMEKISTGKNIFYLCVKEFTGHLADLIGSYLKQRDFIPLPSLPYGTLPVTWQDFPDYLSSLRHHYRRLIKRDLQKMNTAIPVISTYHPSLLASQEPQIILEKGELCTPEIFHRLYLHVMERAGVILEVLNKAFFRELFTHMPEEIELLTFLSRGDITGSAMIHSTGKKMTFLLVGFDYHKIHLHNVYFNLLYAMIRLAIDRGCTILDLGQTSYFVKQRIGAAFYPVSFYLKSKKFFIHTLLKHGRNLLFPLTAIPRINVFKKGKKSNDI